MPVRLVVACILNACSCMCRIHTWRAFHGPLLVGGFGSCTPGCECVYPVGLYVRDAAVVVDRFSVCTAMSDSPPSTGIVVPRSS